VIDTIDRLTVRAVAAPDRKVHAAALERRLATIAATHLPRALARSLHRTVGRTLIVDRLVAHLPPSIAHHDDETVAWIWAGAIAEAVRRRVQATPPPGSERSGDDTVPPVDPGRVDHVPRDEPPGAARSVHDLVVELDSELARHVPQLAAGTVGDRAALVTALAEKTRLSLAATVAWLDAHADGAAGRELVRLAPGNPRRTLVAALEQLRLSPPASDDDRTPGTGGGRVPQDHVEDVRNEGPSRSGDERPIDGEPGRLSATTDAAIRRSTVGGLVLLYPWLTGLLARVGDSVGPAAEHKVAAVQAVLGVAWPVATDPLVAVLAGVRYDQQLDHRLVDATELPADLASDRPLAHFAELLPGTWSPDVVVAELIARPAVVEHAPGGWTVVEGGRPLDALLARLPYPTTALLMPWTEPIAVRWPRHG
jgi:hypothetical protein